jgi:Zn-dependent protease
MADFTPPPPSPGGGTPPQEPPEAAPRESPYGTPAAAPDWHQPPIPYGQPAADPHQPPAPPGYGPPPGGDFGSAGYDPYRGSRPPGYVPGAYAPGGYAPAGYVPGGGVPGTYGQPPAPAKPKRRGGTIGSAIAAAAAFLSKFGLLIFKLGKIGPTAISMLFSLVIYTAIFGWRFAVGFVLLILIHETGHVLFARMEGLPMSLPIFLGPFGAMTVLKAPPRDMRQEAIIAIGGPLFGTCAAAGFFFLGLDVFGGQTRDLLLALAYSGFFLNLFNLMPINPLDGGRVANAVTRWANVVGLVLIGLILLFFIASGSTPNPFLIIILVIGGISTYQRFRSSGRHEGPPPVPAGTRAVIGAGYLAMIAFAAIGMTVAGAQGIQNQGAGGQVSVTSTVRA